MLGKEDSCYYYNDTNDNNECRLENKVVGPLASLR